MTTTSTTTISTETITRKIITSTTNTTKITTTTTTTFMGCDTIELNLVSLKFNDLGHFSTIKTMSSSKMSKFIKFE